MRVKISDNRFLVEDTDQAVSEILNIDNNDNLAIQVVYDANAGGNAYLEASCNGVDFEQITTPITSVVALNVLGGSFMWNLTNAHFRFLRVVVPATDSTTIQLNGNLLRGY